MKIIVFYSFKMDFSVPPELQSVLQDISFAASLPTARHLNSKSRTYDRRWLFNALVRYYQGDSRKEAIDFLERILTRVKQCAERYPNRCLFLSEEILRLHQTCQRLTDFYGETDDPDITSKLNVYRLKINEMSIALKRRALLPPSETGLQPNIIPINNTPNLNHNLNHNPNHNPNSNDLMSTSLPNQLSTTPEGEKFGTPQGGFTHPPSRSQD
jgi:hypothetical protein